MNSPAVTIAVLPFEALSMEPADVMLARGFVYDLLTDLGAFPQLGVIAAESMAAAAGLSISDTEVASRLGAQCILKGSFRRWGEGVRINVRLQDAEGRHLWASRYDGVNLLSLHDEITARIVNALAGKIDQTLLAHARSRPTEALEAYECWLRGMDCIQRGTSETDVEALGYFERALEVDPHYAPAQAGISLSYFNEWSCQSWNQWEEKEAAAFRAALRAEEMDPDNAMVQIILGRVEQYRRRFDLAAPRFERALALAPNDASILIQLAIGFTFLGEAERGTEFGRRALLLNPLGPAWYGSYAAVGPFVLGNFRECLELANQSLSVPIADTRAYMAAASAHLGEREEAARHLELFRDRFRERISCGRETDDEEILRWLIHVNPFRDSEPVRSLADGLRKAGLGGSWRRPVMKPSVPWEVANIFRKEGAAWTLVFDHTVATLPDLRGLKDISCLLARPGEELSCSELAGSGLHSAGIEAADSQSLGNYRRRLREIDVETDEATAAENEPRLIALEEEREAILGEIRRATGLGGRSRKTGAVAERARSAVTWRIRHTIKKITVVHPVLGRHLANSIQTGSTCSYTPEQPVIWQL